MRFCCAYFLLGVSGVGNRAQAWQSCFQVRSQIVGANLWRVNKDLHTSLISSVLVRTSMQAKSKWMGWNLGTHGVPTRGKGKREGTEHF